jgi:hypothetical protein
LERKLRLKSKIETDSKKNIAMDLRRRRRRRRGRGIPDTCSL